MNNLSDDIEDGVEVRGSIPLCSTSSINLFKILRQFS
jgi:hypothetical protein